jgi:hypothetical protein
MWANGAIIDFDLGLVEFEGREVGKPVIGCPDVTGGLWITPV